MVLIDEYSTGIDAATKRHMWDTFHKVAAGKAVVITTRPYPFKAFAPTNIFADSIVTLYPLPDLVPPTPLPQSRKAFTFAVNSTVEKISADGKIQSFDDVTSAGQMAGVPTVVTYLVIGSQRKLVVYSWRDGEVQEVKASVCASHVLTRPHKDVK